MSNNSLPLLPAYKENINHAAQLLRQSQLVAFPTETVYGLGGLAASDAAIAAIYRTKGRPSHNPLIVHVADKVMAEDYALFNNMADALADAFWAGALTLVLPVRKGAVSPLVLAGGDTVALRCPQHEVAEALIRATGKGIAAPSANRSGKVSPTTAQHVYDEFKDNPDTLKLILDGGHTAIGLESTVVDCTGVEPKILRYGSVLEGDIAKTLESLPLLAGQDDSRVSLTYDCPSPNPLLQAEKNGILKSPGLLTSHYAPVTPVRLNADYIIAEEALLAFGDALAVEGAKRAKAVLNLSENGNLEEAAYHLYDYLRQLDNAQASAIAVMPVPHEGIGHAINDRLRRAAAR